MAEPEKTEPKQKKDTVYVNYVRPFNETEKRVLSTVGVLLAIAVFGFIIYDFRRDMDAMPSDLTFVRQSQIDDFESRIAALERSQMAKPSADALKAAGMEAAYQKVTETAARLDKMEASFEADLERALAVPMLRQDLQRLREEQARVMVAITAEIGRMTSLVQWVLGLIAAALLSVSITTLIGTVKAVKQPSETKA